MYLVRGAMISFFRRELPYFFLINFYNIRFFKILIIPALLSLPSCYVALVR